MVCSQSKYSNKPAVSVHSVADSEANGFLLEIKDNLDTFWSTDLEINGHMTHLKLDSGASVTVMSADTPWLRCQVVTSTDKILTDPNTQ